jgi:hypothetical protein
VRRAMITILTFEVTACALMLGYLLGMVLR